MEDVSEIKIKFVFLFQNLLKSSFYSIIFGCKAYTLILNKKINKFKPTAQTYCVMPGYDESEGIYWVLTSQIDLCLEEEI